MKEIVDNFSLECTEKVELYLLVYPSSLLQVTHSIDQSSRKF